MDLVYTWVDDRHPGYMELLRGYARNPHDVNPNRTRDNLDILKYSLRSVSHYLEWIDRIYIISMRPQVPAWLDTGHKGVSVVHHDQIMDAEYLPTFNSFPIFSYIHKIEGLSDNFLFMEDDMLIGRRFDEADLYDQSGLMKIYPRLSVTPSADSELTEDDSPWNHGLANSNRLLDRRYGVSRRPYVNHVPLVINKQGWEEMISTWSGEIGQTRSSRFRSSSDVITEYLYPYYMYYEKKASMQGRLDTIKNCFYHGIENQAWKNFVAFTIEGMHPFMYLTFNDNLDASPDIKVVDRCKAYLQKRFPWKSEYEL